MVLVDYFGGCARDEVLCHPKEVHEDFGVLASRPRRWFGSLETALSLPTEFHRTCNLRARLAGYS